MASSATRSFFLRLGLGGVLAGAALTARAQAVLTPIQRWQHLDQQADGVPGISADRAYRELLAGRTATPVLVAVIDSGIDSAHAELKPILWRNAKEVAGNGQDDDHNGYVDDVRGWNFLGGKDGQNVGFERLEQVRLYAQLRPQFEGKKRKNVAPAEQAQFDLYEKVKASYEKTRLTEEERYNRLRGALASNTAIYTQVKSELGVPLLDLEVLRQASLTRPDVKYATPLYNFLQKNNFASAEVALKDLREAVEHYQNRVEKNLNLAYNPRPLVGDDPTNLTQTGYGNPDSQGPDASHGTHCAGIIGAVRTDQRGVEGVAGAVRIMSVRAVPSGDERDKDVANAIRYAVDNGAQIISMSFGKDFSPDKATVDAAMQYAEQKGVLLVHAAGNDSRNIDTDTGYPSARYLSGELIPNLLTVGASSRTNTAELAGSFSNFGPQSVDLFAPGVDIYSCAPGNTYATHSGTSMAAPVVAGVAAVLKAYFPQLTAAQLKQCLVQSAVPYHTKVAQPGSKTLVDFASLSRSGGIVNLYAAVQQAALLTAAH
ncbi:S8 family serine peptidase [Hymenobacter sp. BRD128]|uniref:S8 family serine peptidase n=1 Tax=Hymenobacter sp. BRD128 TaxID=2675878 RepID=UPI001566CF19|nr:S8 family serine peptidase [Hymenobacter sp. BRD128]QKG56180.1 S8 family serine peptidase [Hymenobacter sp. BRD128]